MTQQPIYHWDGQNLILSVKVQPKYSLQGDILAPSQDGKANGQLIKFLAKNFGVAKSRIQLLSGESGRKKRIRITSPDKDKVIRLLPKL